jgi:hypothetical protein
MRCTNLSTPRHIRHFRSIEAQQLLRTLEARGRGVAWIAEHVGVSPRAIGHWRLGTHAPHAGLLRRLRALAHKETRHG